MSEPHTVSASLKLYSHSPRNAIFLVELSRLEVICAVFFVTRVCWFTTVMLASECGTARGASTHELWRRLRATQAWRWYDNASVVHSSGFPLCAGKKKKKKKVLRCFRVKNKPHYSPFSLPMIKKSQSAQLSHTRPIRTARACCSLQLPPLEMKVSATFPPVYAH